MTYYLVAQRLNPLPAMRETWVQSLGPGGRSPGEGNDNPLQYSCLENPMDIRAWWDTVHGVAKSRTRLSNFTFIFFHFHLFIHCCIWFSNMWFRNFAIMFLNKMDPYFVFKHGPCLVRYQVCSYFRR